MGDRVCLRGRTRSRCLPLHTFSPFRDWPKLATNQDDFERLHGKSGARLDERRRRWEKDKSAHGNDIDVVAGYSMHRVITGMSKSIETSPASGMQRKSGACQPEGTSTCTRTPASAVVI